LSIESNTLAFWMIRNGFQFYSKIPTIDLEHFGNFRFNRNACRL